MVNLHTAKQIHDKRLNHNVLYVHLVTVLLQCVEMLPSLIYLACCTVIFTAQAV